MLDRTELILSQRKIPALSNPARISLSLSLSLVSRPTTTIDKSHLSFSLPLPLSNIFSPFIPPSLSSSRILLILSLSLFSFRSIYFGRTESVENDYPPWKIRVRSGQSRLFEARREQQSSAARGQRRVSCLRVDTRGPSADRGGPGSATIDRWHVHRDSRWAHIRNSKFLRSFFRAVASRRSTAADLSGATTTTAAAANGGGGGGGVAASVLWGRLVRRVPCGYIWRGVPRKNSSSPGTKLGGGGGGKKMEAPGWMMKRGDRDGGRGGTRLKTRRERNAREKSNGGWERLITGRARRGKIGKRGREMDVDEDEEGWWRRCCELRVPVWGRRETKWKRDMREHALLLTKGRDSAPVESWTHVCASFLPKRSTRSDRGPWNSSYWNSF